MTALGDDFPAASAMSVAAAGNGPIEVVRLLKGKWKDKLCFPNAVDCDVNFPVVGFSEFSGWGGSARNGHEQPSWTIKGVFLSINT